MCVYQMSMSFQIIQGISEFGVITSVEVQLFSGETLSNLYQLFQSF